MSPHCLHFFDRFYQPIPHTQCIVAIAMSASKWGFTKRSRWAYSKVNRPPPRHLKGIHQQSSHGHKGYTNSWSIDLLPGIRKGYTNNHHTVHRPPPWHPKGIHQQYTNKSIDLLPGTRKGYTNSWSIDLLPGTRKGYTNNHHTLFWLYSGTTRS
jgi:hypothetical protein